MLSYQPSSESKLKPLAVALAEAKKRGINPLIDPIAAFRDSNPVHWIQSHFIIPETGKPLQFEPYQKQAIREALKRTDGIHYDHSVIIWSDVKKSAKSTIAAAVALWCAFQVEWGQIIIVANDLKQADSRVGFYLRRAIELNPELSKICKIIKYRVELPNHTFIEMVPIDPSGEAGGNAEIGRAHV